MRPAAAADDTGPVGAGRGAPAAQPGSPGDGARPADDLGAGAAPNPPVGIPSGAAAASATPTKALPQRSVDHVAEPRATALPEPARTTATAPMALPMQMALRVLGGIVAPATLVAALMYYFGRLHATNFFAYLGVHFTVFDLTTIDYLVRSQDGLFLPIAVAGLGVLIVVWGRRIVGRRLPAATRASLRRLATPLVAVAGLAGLVVAAWGAVRPTAFAQAAVLPGIALASGVALLAYAARAGSETTGISAAAIVEWAAVFVLVSVGLFWAVANYSAALGAARAREFHARLGERPTVALVSEKDLGLSGVRAIPCADGTGVRYVGLVLVLQAGGRYLFLPAGWNPGEGPAILLPESDVVHLEFRTSPPPDSTTPASC